MGCPQCYEKGVAIVEPSPNETIRLAHLSDIHITTKVCAWRREDWMNKRLAAWMNLRLLGRGYRFRRAEQVLMVLAHELRERPFDHIVFSGDATAMGFEEEVRQAVSLLPVGELPGLAVPGNHDYCTRTAMQAGHFERFFAPWQVGERIGKETYPFAQRVGHIWLIAVNSATANRWAWDARGAVGLHQLDRLEQLLARLEGYPRILVTHYPVARPSGRREPVVRHLRDLDRVIEVAAKGGVSLWLHGHIHDNYHHVLTTLAPFPVICSGSATQTGFWSYGEYTITGKRLEGQQRVYDAKQGIFANGRTFAVDLPCSAGAGTLS